MKNKNQYAKYIKNPKKYNLLVDKLYRENSWLHLPPEYSMFFKTNILRFLIRLSRYKVICRQLRLNQTCLEIGSGSGLGAIFMSQFCKNVTGLELKPNEFQEACQINCKKNVQFVQKDFFQIDKKIKYDNIVLLDVIEHLNKSDGIKMLKKIKIHLSENGAAFIGTPSIYSFPFQSQFSKLAHVHCYDQDELWKILENIFSKVFCFCMNDETLHTGNPKMAWYYLFIVC